MAARPSSAAHVLDEECWESGCQNLATTSGYCRAHYIKNWAAIRRKQAIVQSPAFRKFIADLIARYPEHVLQAIREDLATDAAFERAVADLELHESSAELATLDSDQVDESNLFEPPASDLDALEDLSHLKKEE